MRFLLSRRWLLFAVAVGLLAWLATLLGQWQFHRLDERREKNELVERNLDRAPVPANEVLRVGSQPSQDDEWRRVVAHGTWDDELSIVVKYKTREGASGVDVVTPLRTPDGPAVLVDRGWMPTENTGGKRPDLPDASPGLVTVVGWVRRDGTGSSTEITDLSTRAISSREAADLLPYPLYGGFVALETERPEPPEPLAVAEVPDVGSEGPHFFYGLQWWFFGALAIFGFGYLVYDEWRRARRASEGPEHATVDGEHDPGDE